MPAKPDAPIGASVEDLLGRLPFVDEIVDLANTTPKEWAPRIGIYGSWGSGKTSVLNMVTERLIAAHHVVARFNPWGFHDVDEMFGALADAVIEAIEAQGDDIKKAARKAERISKLVQKGTKVAGDATKHAGDVGLPGAKLVRGALATVGYASGVLRRVFEKKKIAQLLEALDELPDHTRCVVLVDDLDRAEPALLPPLLFALHEVLVAMSITFVIALDPSVVGAALKAHHPGFGDGLAFLEKMIQFPRWLPEVTDEDRWRLATNDVANYLPVIDREALRQEFDRFPRNPRELRTLIRGMWGLNAQAKRYRPSEISWNLVLRLAALRHRYRQALDVLLEDEQRLTKLIARRLAVTVRAGSAEAPITDPGIEQALRERGIETTCLPHLLSALGGHLVWDGSTVIRHARLVERPPAITQLEMANLITSITRRESTTVAIEDVRAALVKHAESIHRPIEQVVDDAISRVLAMHDEALSQSADDVFEAATIAKTNAATGFVGLVGAILHAHAETASPDQFRRILLAFSRWAHFDTLECYRTLHAREHELLLQLCHDTRDPGAYLEVLQPWVRHTEGEEQAVRLRGELERVLVTAIDPTLDRILERPDGVSGMLSEQRSAERWCLLRRSAWTTERIERVRALNTDAASDNALDLVRLLADAGENARPGKYGVDHRELDAMAADREISDAVWTVLTRRPLNMRFFTSVEKMRTALEERRGAPLPEPVWWARVRAIRDATAVRKQQEAADEDEEPPPATNWRLNASVVRLTTWRIRGSNP